MKTSDILKYFDRYTKKIVIEPVYASSFLFWSYNTRIGLFLTRNIFSQKVVSKFYGWFNKTKWSRKKIKPFVNIMNVNTNELINNLSDFNSFNDFFIRKIDLRKRPVNQNPEVCVTPADGRIFVYPSIEANSEFYIKRNKFNLREFLRDDKLVNLYSGGSMLITRLYLTDYHHFHFPTKGYVSEPKAIKGKYYTSTSYSLESIIPFYSENFRMRTKLESKNFGQILMVEVGAFTVGSIIQDFHHNEQVNKGEHKGFFEIGGSTIVLLFERGKIEFDSDLIENSNKGIETFVKMGDSIGKTTKV